MSYISGKQLSTRLFQIITRAREDLENIFVHIESHTDAISGKQSVDSIRRIVGPAIVYRIACSGRLISESAGQCRIRIGRSVCAAHIIRWYSGGRSRAVVWIYCEVFVLAFKFECVAVCGTASIQNN